MPSSLKQQINSVDADAVEEELEADGISVRTMALEISPSISIKYGRHNYVLIDKARLSGAEKAAALIHEQGHFAQNAFYNLSSPFDLVEKQEYKANKWAVRKYIPKAEIIKAARGGCTELWQLAEHFNVTEDMVRFACRLYGLCA